MGDTDSAGGLEHFRRADGGLPHWLARLPERLSTVPDHWFSRFQPPEDADARDSAVLILFGPGDGTDTEVVITERSHTMRSHAGQAAFPRGGREAEDSDLVATALREAQEEIGVEPTGVQVVASLPVLHLPVRPGPATARHLRESARSAAAGPGQPTREAPRVLPNNVLPVVGWWREPAPIGVADPSEVERVVQVGVQDLVDPANRFQVRHPSGFIGPAFDAHGLLVWGFTAGLLDRTLHLAGLDREWDRSRVRDLPG